MTTPRESWPIIDGQLRVEAASEIDRFIEFVVLGEFPETKDVTFNVSTAQLQRAAALLREAREILERKQ